MKQSIYHSSEHQFPVNYLKSDAELPEVKLSADEKITGFGFEGKAVLPQVAKSLKGAIRSSDVFGNSRGLIRSGVFFLLRSIRLLFLTFCNWMAPYYNKGVVLYQSFVERVAGYLDVLFNFMESFLFLDEAVLQPAVISQTNKPLQNRQSLSENRSAIITGRREHFSPKVTAAQRNDDNSSFVNSSKKAQGKRFNLTIFPKIKLPLKTNNPDVWLPRPLLDYPAGEYLQLIFFRCSKLFRLNPKHLNTVLKQHFKPVFKAVN